VPNKEILILAFDLQLIGTKTGVKHLCRLMKNFVHLRSTCSLSALCALNTIRIKWGSYICFGTTDYLNWKWVLYMTCANW